MAKIFLFVLLVALIGYGHGYVTLPGYSGPELKLRTGYIDLDGGKHVFYWLFESRNAPSTDPLVVWYQGGPGCSGEPGLFTEHGPLAPSKDGGLEARELSWLNVANMLYVDQPAGVGYSYGDNRSALTTNDTQAATDNHSFIQKFMDEYPEYKGRDLWLTGESYGGVYVPSLAKRLVQDTALSAQFKGFMVGNPVFSCDSYNYNDGMVNIAYWHGLAPFSLYSKWQSNNCATTSTDSDTCRSLFQTIMSSIGGMDQPTQTKSFALRTQKERFQPINPDDLFYDFCVGNGSLAIGLDDPKSKQCQYINDDDLLSVYLNRKDVLEAIGAKVQSWEACSGPPQLFYNALGESMIPTYRFIFEKKPSLRVLVFSGDLDMFTVPAWSTQACLAELEEDVELQKRWHQWTVNGATAGYYEVYNRYTYATVRGGGHEVPKFEPFTALQLFTRFLKNEPLGEFEDTSAAEVRPPNVLSGNLRKRGITH